MDRFTEIPLALSIRQPWVDLVLRGMKTIEVREWSIARRGPFLIHASATIDWKTAELLGYDEIRELPRAGLLAVAKILDVIQFDRRSWLDLMSRHRVIHPPVREPVYGALLGDVLAFRRRVPCRGRPLFFPVPARAEPDTRAELAALGLID